MVSIRLGLSDHLLYVWYGKRGSDKINQLIVYPLLALIILGAFSQLYHAGTTEYDTVDLSYNNTVSGIVAEGNQTITGSEDEFTGDAQDAVFDINMITGFLAIVIGLVAVGVVAGIKVLGSGIDSYSVQLIHKATSYYGLWGVFSALALPVFIGIPYLGLVLWLIMTLLYTLGFFATLSGSGGSS